MDYDKGLVAAVLKEGASSVRAVREKLPSADFVRGEGKLAYDFVVGYVSTYGDAPSLKLVQEHTGVNLDPDPLASSEELDAPSLWWVEQLVDRKLHEGLRSTGSVLIKNLELGKTQAALDALESAVKGIRKQITAADAGIQTLGQAGKEVWEYYLALKNGKRGVLTPWSGVNDATLGIWPQDLALLVARTGVGKSWAASIIAQHAWESGHKVLFATTEMSRVIIAMRVLAIKYKFNYRNFSRGALTFQQEEYFEKDLEELLKEERFYVAGGNFDFRVESFASLVEEYEPDICVLDGAYLLRVDGNSRTERAANAFDEIKRIGNYTSVPMLCTMQFNRQAKTNMASTADLANIGLTDVGGWNANLAYALMQSDDEKKEGIMNFHPMKVREGVGEKVKVRWDLDNMAFDQIAVGDEDEGAGDAVESPFAPTFSSPWETSKSDSEDTPF